MVDRVDELFHGDLVRVKYHPRLLLSEAHLGLLYTLELPPPAADPWSEAEISRATPPVLAPAVELLDLRGNRLDLRQFHGRIVLLYFWGSW